MEDGTIVENADTGTDTSGWHWGITTKDGLQAPQSRYWLNEPNFYKATPGYESGWSKKPYPDISEFKTQRIHEGTERQCTGFMNREGNTFFGHQLFKVQKLTFFTSDNGAMKAVAQINKEAEEKKKLELARVEMWRKKIQLGSDTHCGMVIDTKAPLVKVQTSIGEKWFKLMQLYPAGEKQCVFVQGQYQE